MALSQLASQQRFHDDHSEPTRHVSRMTQTQHAASQLLMYELNAAAAWAAMAHPHQPLHPARQYCNSCCGKVKTSQTVNPAAALLSATISTNAVTHAASDECPAAGSNMQQPSCVTSHACTQGQLLLQQQGQALAAANSPPQQLPSHCTSQAPARCACRCCQGTKFCLLLPRCSSLLAMAPAAPQKRPEASSQLCLGDRHT